MSLKDNIMENLSEAALECIAREKPIELHPMIFAAVMAEGNPDLSLYLSGKGEVDK